MLLFGNSDTHVDEDIRVNSWKGVPILVYQCDCQSRVITFFDLYKFLETWSIIEVRTEGRGDGETIQDVSRITHPIGDKRAPNDDRIDWGTVGESVSQGGITGRLDHRRIRPSRIPNE